MALIPFPAIDDEEPLEEPVEEGVVVDLGETAPAEEHGGALITQDGNGGMTVDFAPRSRVDVDAQAHDANLAEVLDERRLGEIAEKVLEWFEADLDARAPDDERLKKGLEIIGMADVPDMEGPFPGAAKVVHPLILEAMVQFQARAMEEVFPASGPVKGSVVGDKTEELDEQATRVEDYMNYQILYEDRQYFWDTDKMLFWLPFIGSVFKKVYFDDEARIVKSRTVLRKDLLLPYHATNLLDAPRVIHFFPVQHQDFLDGVAAGMYRDVELEEPQDTTADTGINDELDEVDDITAAVAEGDTPHTFIECHCKLGLQSWEDQADEYVVTLDRDSRTVVALRRNWREQDERRERRRCFVQYPYLPGFGVYGWGLVHAIGSLNETTTGLIRAVLDGAALASLQGGFKTKDASNKAGEIIIEPGKYKDVDMTAEELSKAFYTPPFKEPSPALAQIFEILQDSGRRFATTVEVAVGDANNNGPVGTTLALIEQASKPFSGIHKRIHFAAGEEFRIRAELNYDYLPDEPYPYEVAGASKFVRREDFDGRVDVIPVSDPNIWSNTQRIAMAQAVKQMADANPQAYDTYEVDKMMLRALRVPNIDEILPNPNEVPMTDPVSEGAYLLIGKPIRAHLEEDHAAHIAVHQAQLPMLQASPMAQIVLPAMQAHISEHMAMQYRIQVFAQLGLPPQPLDYRRRDPMSLEVNNAIAQGTAILLVQQAQQQAVMMQQQQAAVAEQGQAAQQQDAEQATMQDIEKQDLQAAGDFLREQGAMDVDPRTLLETSRQTGKSFDQALAIIRKAVADGQGAGPAPIAEEAAT